MVLLQTTIFHQKYDFAINLLTPISSKWVETVYLSSLYWKITICIVDWKIYCMVFFNFLVMCSYKNAIYCYKYDIDIWIQSIILTSFYSFSQGAGGGFDPNIFEVYILGIHYLLFDFCYLHACLFMYLSTLWSVHDEAAWDLKETRWEPNGFLWWTLVVAGSWGILTGLLHHWGTPESQSTSSWRMSHQVR